MLRQAFEGGPAYLTWDGVTIQMADDWDAKVEAKVVDRKTNLQGVVGSGMDYLLVKISAKPVAMSSNLATLIAKLHPYKASDRGKLIFPGTDNPAVIQGKDGKTLTFKAGAITKEPNITFAPNVDLFDAFELTCLLENEGDPADISDLVTASTSAYAEPTFNPSSIISDRYLLAWGETYDEIETDEKGIVLEPSLKLTECITQLDGLLNYRIDEKTATVKFTPVNMASADFLELIPAVGRGAMIGVHGLPLTVTPASGDGLKLTAPLAVPTDPTARFGVESRIGEVTMRCERSYSSSLLEPYALEVVASD